MFVPVHWSFELENLRRSIAMANPGHRRWTERCGSERSGTVLRILLDES